MPSRINYPVPSYGTLRPRVMVIHKTAGDAFDTGSDAAAYCRSNPEGNRWHRTIGWDGTVWVHLDWDELGQHAASINSISVGIEFDLENDRMPSEAMLKAGAKEVADFCRFIGRRPSRDFIIGHNEDHKFGGTSSHVDPGVWPWEKFMAYVEAAYEGEEPMTDREREQLKKALELAREHEAFLNGMLAYKNQEPEPARPGPKRAGYRFAHELVRLAQK